MKYITKNFELPIIRFSADSHLIMYNEKKGTCIYCRWKNQQSDQKIKDFSSPKVNFYCEICKEYLCCNSNRNCFYDFHITK